MAKEYYRKIFLIFIAILSCLFAYASSSQSQCDEIIRKGLKNVRINKDYPEGLRQLQHALTMAEQGGWYLQQYYALNGIGVLYQMNYDYGEALIFFTKAYTIANEHLKGNERKSVINNIAITYVQWGNCSMACKYFMKAYSLARQDKDTFRIAMYALNLADVYCDMDNPDKANRFIRTAKDYASKGPQIKNYASYLDMRTRQLKGEDKMVVAIGNSLIRQQGIRNNDDLWTGVHLLMAKAMKRLGRYHEAATYARTALSGHPDPKRRTELYKLIAEICRKTHDYVGALGYKDSIILFNDSLLRQKGNNLFSISQARLEIQQAQFDLSAKRARFNVAIIISVIILVVIVVLTVTIIKIRRARIKYEEALMKKELSFRKNELMAKTLYISGRDQLLENLFESLHTSGNEDAIPPAMMSKLRNHLTTAKDGMSSRSSLNRQTTASSKN